MRKQYLHLSAYSCDRCQGPVVSGSLAIRENEISRETDVREVGAICLTCGNRQGKDTEAGITRDFPPVRWESMNGIDPRYISTAFGEMINRAEPR